MDETKVEYKPVGGGGCVCEYCGKSFPFHSVLLGHQRIHTGERPYSCDFCDKTFAQKGSLTIHIRRHTGEKPYDCHFCGKRFASQGNMKIHERQHTGIKPYECGVCKKRFATVGSLKTHEVTHSDSKVHTCDECGKTFAHRASLYTHKKRHAFAADSISNNTTPEAECSTTSSSPASVERKERDKKWACRFCGKKFAFKHPMVAHERVHTGEKPFNCRFCGKAFGQQTSLIMHERSHTGERRYKCEICEKRFIQPAALHAHRRSHTGEKPYLCKVCPKAFAHATSLRQHQLVHTREALKQLTDNQADTNPDTKQRILEQLNAMSQNGTVVDASSMRANSPPKPIHTCFCGKSFAYLSILESHMRVHSGEKPFMCQVCGKRFAQKATMQVHMRTHTGERPYKCRFCERTFAQYGTKTVHERSHTGIRCYKCPTCGKMLSSPSALYTHKKTHGERSYQCEICMKRFTLNNYLKLHMKQVHDKEGKDHPCHVCGKSFAYAGSLQVHLRCHSGERPFICRYCPKSFTSQGNLQSHERIHTGIKPFQCKTCGKCFAQRSQLSVHASVHVENGKKSNAFMCKFCDKKFAYASSLYVHVRLHTGERPFQCRYCDKQFTNQGNMQVHERVHTRERPFRCPACDKCYAQKVGLKIHLEQCQKYKTAKSSSTGVERNSEQVFKREQQIKVKKNRLENLLPKLLKYRVNHAEEQPRQQVNHSEKNRIASADFGNTALPSSIDSWKSLTLPTVLSPPPPPSASSSSSSASFYGDSPFEPAVVPSANATGMLLSEPKIENFADDRCNSRFVGYPGCFGRRFSDPMPPYNIKLEPTFDGYEEKFAKDVVGGSPYLDYHRMIAAASTPFNGQGFPYYVGSDGLVHSAFFSPLSVPTPYEAITPPLRAADDLLLQDELFSVKRQLQNCLTSIERASDDGGVMQARF